MKLYGAWIKPRLYFKLVEHILLLILMVLVPFYIQGDKAKL